MSQPNTFTGRLTEEMLDALFLRARELAADPGSSGGPSVRDAVPSEAAALIALGPFSRPR